MNSEKDQLMPETYDGIEEYDNPIPLWLNLIFWGTILFSIGYMAYFHVFDIGDLPREAYEVEMQKAAEAAEARAAQQPAMDAAALASDTDAAAAGEKVYATNCASCHGPKGEGSIGPDLTDGEWIHGDGSLESIVTTVDQGVPQKGMPPWGPVLGAEKVQQVSAYVAAMSEGEAAAKPATAAP